MKDKITDLRHHLFAQLERLGDEDLSPEQLKQEIKRGHAIAQVAKEITATAKVEVQFLRIKNATSGTTFFPEPQTVKQLKE